MVIHYLEGNIEGYFVYMAKNIDQYYLTIFEAVRAIFVFRSFEFTSEIPDEGFSFEVMLKCLLLNKLKTNRLEKLNERKANLCVTATYAQCKQ